MCSPRRSLAFWVSRALTTQWDPQTIWQLTYVHFQQLSSAGLEALLNTHGSFVFKDVFSWPVLPVCLSL